MKQTLNQAIIDDFRKLSTHESLIFNNQFKTEDVSIFFNKKSHKKYVFTKTQATINNPYNRWDSKFIHCGKTNRLTVIDVDYAETEPCKILLPMLFEEASIVVATRKGYHFYFFYNEKLKSRTGGSNGFDILSDNKNVISPSSSYYDEDDNLFTYEAYVAIQYGNDILNFVRMSDELTDLILHFEKQTTTSREPEIDTNQLKRYS